MQNETFFRSTVDRLHDLDVLGVKKMRFEFEYCLDTCI